MHKFEVCVCMYTNLFSLIAFSHGGIRVVSKKSVHALSNHHRITGKSKKLYNVQIYFKQEQKGVKRRLTDVNVCRKKAFI